MTASTITGGGGNDKLYGGSESDSVLGEGGADLIDGGTGADQLYGGSGNDTILGGGEADSIFGGTGDDSLLGDTGNDTIYFDTGNDTIYGGDGDDIIDDLNNVQYSGVNLIYGGAGNDAIWSGLDSDTVYGGSENDTIYAEGGNDSITGGSGTDVLYGGDDRDRFIYQAGDAAMGESVFGGSGGDDFDTLDLSGYGWARTDIQYSASNPQDGTVTFYDDLGNVVGTLSFTDIEMVVPCFTEGTLIQTPDGPRRVESLRPGDLVETLDDGPQPLRWVGRRRLGVADLVAEPALVPVRIKAGALGPGCPATAITFSPQHRILFDGAVCELYFGEVQVLVPAIHLAGRPGISRPNHAVTYVHLLFDRHQIVRAHGLWSESYQPAQRTLQGLPDPQRDELLQLFPELADRDCYPAARTTLKAFESHVLLDA
jgi:hypothetical protein